MRKLLSCVVLAGLLVGCSEQLKSDISVQDDQSKNNNNGVPESIVDSLEYYTPEQYPDMYKTWGDDGVLKIKSLVVPAAELVIKSGSCDKLEYVMLHDDKSSPNGDIVFFADCENRKRFYVSDKDIAADRNVVSEQDKKHDTQGAVKRCEEKIKSNLAHPGTYSRHITDTGTDITQVGDIRVVIGFTAKNGLGMEVDYRAICIDSDNGTDLMGIDQK